MRRINEGTSLKILEMVSLPGETVAVEIREARLPRFGRWQPAQQMVERSILHRHHDDVIQPAVCRRRWPWDIGGAGAAEESRTSANRQAREEFTPRGYGGAEYCRMPDHVSPQSA